MTIKNTFNTIKSAILNNLKEIAISAIVIGAILITPIGTVKNKVFQSRIILTNNPVNMLTVAKAKTEVITGISKNDMDSLNQNPTPELIKQYMCTIAPEYGVDWKLVYAIGYHESGNYNSSLAQRNNNYFGRKATSGTYASWSTPEEGIRNQFDYIKDHYYNRGLITPAAINPIYAEDSSWSYAVSSVMNTL
jgi:hypothetical protein